MRQHGAGIEHALDQRFHLAAAFFHAEEPRLEYARVIHHQQVAGLQQFKDVGELAIVQLITIDMQQARSTAIRQGKLRYPLWRQVKIEV
ncbi:hypothetical protein GCM10027277_13810 [Pseudoduganella ginsengisoli]